MRCPGACDLAEWNVPHAPHEHRSLLVEIDEDGGKGLAEQQVFTTADTHETAIYRFLCVC